MTTEQLAACGCFSVSIGGNHSDSLPAGETRPPGQSVIIQNYLCARRTAGITKVVVINGIANRVFE
jgi:hypothetical protein